MIHIGLLHIATAATLGDDAGMIGAFHHYAAVSAEVVVNVHTALGVVQRGDFSIRPLGNRAAIPGLDSGLVLRSEEHTSELQSLRHLVCRLLLEKKKNDGGVGAGYGWRLHRRWLLTYKGRP